MAKDPKVGTGKKPKGSGRRLYTDENPKGTIQGLGFKDVATAKASINKIKNSGKTLNIFSIIWIFLIDDQI